MFLMLETPNQAELVIKQNYINTLSFNFPALHNHTCLWFPKIHFSEFEVRFCFTFFCTTVQFPFNEINLSLKSTEPQTLP